MVSERQKVVLEALVREYVDTAEPVSSGELVKKCGLPFSSATVRNELLELDRKGLIFQPHTSAGRVPTDKGYRFFIEQSLKDDDGETEIEKSIRQLYSIGDEFDFLRQSSRILAHFSGEFSMAGFFGRGFLYKSGLAEAFQGAEFSDETMVREFGALADFLDEEIQDFFSPEDLKEPRVFIGAENPIPGAKNYTLMVSSSLTPFNEEGIFVILGPRRMDYERNLSLLKTFGRIFNPIG